SVVVMFGLSVLAAIGVRELSAPRSAQRRISHKEDKSHYVVFVVIAAASLEWLHLPPALVAAPALHSEVGQWLAREPGAGAVAILPLGLDIDATPAMVQSLEHRRPIVNGYSGQRPDFYRPLAETINTFPSPDALAALHDARVRFVITPEPIEPTEPPEPFRESARFP